MIAENTVNVITTGKFPTCHYCACTGHFIAGCMTRKKHQQQGTIARTSEAAARILGSKGPGGFKGNFSRESCRGGFRGNFRVNRGGLAMTRRKETTDQCGLPTIGHVEEAHGRVVDGVYYPFTATNVLDNAPVQETDRENEEGAGVIFDVSFGSEVAHISHMTHHLENEQPNCFDDVQATVDAAFAQLEL